MALCCVTLSCPALHCSPEKVPINSYQQKSKPYPCSTSWPTLAVMQRYVGSGRGAGSKRQEDTFALALRWMKGIELAA